MPVPDRSAGVSRRLLRDVAHTALRKAILDGTFAPGERLRDTELCAWLELSRTPVREALTRLEEDGLVETAPQRYTRVAPLDRDEARDAFELVAAIQALAARLAVPRMGAAELERARAANRRFAAALAQRDVDAALAADDEFHGVFLDAAGNREIPRSLARLLPRLRRLERLRFGSLRGRRSVRQHERIIAAAARGDADEAGTAALENWRSLGALIDQTFHDDAGERREGAA
jgi:DNA-binding GntR family transcriptional regulator